MLEGAAVQKGLEPGGRGIALVRSRYEEKSSEVIAGWKRLGVCAIVICKVWRPAMAV
jgi:hypothetical protein